jgi:hypothetical protein
MYRIASIYFLVLALVEFTVLTNIVSQRTYENARPKRDVSEDDCYVMVIAAALLRAYELDVVFILKAPHSASSLLKALLAAGSSSLVSARLALLKLSQGSANLPVAYGQHQGAGEEKDTHRVKGNLQKSLRKIRNIRTVLDNEVKLVVLDTGSLEHQSSSLTTIHVYWKRTLPFALQEKTSPSRTKLSGMQTSTLRPNSRISFTQETPESSTDFLVSRYFVAEIKDNRLPPRRDIPCRSHPAYGFISTVRPIPVAGNEVRVGAESAKAIHDGDFNQVDVGMGLNSR